MNAKTKNGLIMLVMLSFLFCVVVLPAQAAQKPDAQFSVTPKSGNAPLKVTFTDESTGGKALWKWWGFGDRTGSNSTANTIKHTYTKAGTYKVFLKATNAAGSDTSDPQYITVFNNFKLSNKGVAFIKEHEGTHIVTKTGLHTMYEDSQGHCTVGYGHLVHKGGIDGRASENPYKNGITEAEAEALFKKDVATYEKAVNKHVNVPLEQYQFDALVSFTYNIGIGDRDHGFRGSSALRELNKGNYNIVPSKMLLWNIPKEIVGRRTDEANLFKKGRY